MYDRYQVRVIDYLYAREDYETNINTNGSTPSKPH